MAGHMTSVFVHFVWSTKNRLPLIIRKWEGRLHQYFRGVLDNRKCRLICSGGMPDHIHLLVSLWPTRSISRTVNDLKSNSSRWVHQTFPELDYFAWQNGYGAFSVSKSHVQRVTAYIRNQEKHHTNRSFKEEFRRLLRKHEISCDEEFVWD